MDQNIDRYTGLKRSESMSKCTFFGHSDCSGEIRADLLKTVMKLIEEENVNEFYVGNNGFLISW